MESTGTIPSNTWQYFVIPGDTWKYLTILLQYFMILINTYQFLTIPNNTWWTWYQLVSPGINKASWITTNTIPVSIWYHHDMVLTVFCLSGLVSSQYWFWQFLQNLQCLVGIVGVITNNSKRLFNSHSYWCPVLYGLF